MSTPTNNMGLTKPGPNDLADIAVINANMETLDGHRHGGGVSGLPVQIQSGSGTSMRASSPSPGQLYLVMEEGPALYFYNGTNSTNGTWMKVLGVPEGQSGSGGVTTQNLLVNPGFEIAQRGAGPFTVDGAYTLDRWQNQISLGSVAVSQITSTIGSSGKSVRCAYTHVASAWHQINQKVEWSDQYRGKTLALSVRVKSTVAGTVRAWISTSAGGVVYGSYNAGTGDEKLTVLTTLPSNATDLYVGIRCDVASCTVEVNDAMLCISPTPVDYLPLPSADDWARCLRYFGKYGAAQWAIACSCYVSGAQVIQTRVGFNARMVIVPTVTKMGTWSAGNSGQPAPTGTTEDGTGLIGIAGGAGAAYFYTNDATTYIAAEANP